MQSHCKRRVNQTAVVCHTDPLIPTQSVPPGQHFPQQLLRKMTKPVRYFYWSVVSLDVLASPSLPFSPDSLSCSFTIFHSPFRLKSSALMELSSSVLTGMHQSILLHSATVFLCLDRLSIYQCQCHAYRKVDESITLCCCLSLLHLPPLHSNKVHPCLHSSFHPFIHFGYLLRSHQKVAQQNSSAHLPKVCASRGLVTDTRASWHYHTGQLG